jgi:putative ATPase
LEEAKRVKRMDQRTLFFVNEFHIFNKAQQDAIWPVIEDRIIVFIGATTENPSFEVNNTLLSRCRVLTLNKLHPEMVVILWRHMIQKAIAPKSDCAAILFGGRCENEHTGYSQGFLEIGWVLDTKTHSVKHTHWADLLILSTYAWRIYINKKLCSILLW